MRDFDFTGFKFNGKHSSDLGIYRVSGGDRYEESLHPDIEDRTAEVPGLDGSYFFGTNYKPRTIEIEIAFDSLTEKGLRDLRRVFNPRQNGELIFDELPYKKYIAKLESPMELSYVCFEEQKREIVGSNIGDERYGVRRVTREEEVTTIDEETGETITETIIHRDLERIYPYELQSGTQRIYKGEGKISFICYFPFAKSAYKSIPTGKEESDWAISSGILTSSEYQNVDRYDSGQINIYNGGDLETGFRLYVPGAPSEGMTLSYSKDGIEDNTASLVIDSFDLENGDIGFLIDTDNALIVGVKPQTIIVDDQEVQVGITYDQDGNAIYKTSGNLYNKYISSGYFFHLEPNDKSDNATLQIEGGMEGIEIFYDYLYF